MRELTRKNCELLIQNWNTTKEIFRWDGRLITLSCAAVFTAKGLVADPMVLIDNKIFLKSQVGPFNNFKSLSRDPIITMMSTSDNGPEALKRGLMVYDLLKQKFFTSTYLPMAAMIIGQMAEPYRYNEIVDRTKEIYKLMKSEHPLITSSEDSALCALLALSDKNVDSLVMEIEECYRLLKEHFFNKNAIQSLAHVLALGEGSAKSKCYKTFEIFDKLKKAGHKYGTCYELSTLGILVLSGQDVDQIVADIVEVDEWLAGQRGFGFFSSVSKKQRLMYAGMLVQSEIAASDTMNTAAVNSTISLIVAQQAALCAAVAATAASASSASS